MAGSSVTPKKIRCIAIAILALIVLIGLTVLIVYLVIRPKSLKYTIEDGSVHGYDMKYNHINASFYFVLKAYNPNRRVSVYYDSMQVTLLYDDQPIAFDMVEPFFQHHRNVTHLDLKPVARSAPLLVSAAKDLSMERSSGEMELTIKVKARIHFKVGKWKSSKRTLWVTCSQVDLNFSSSKSFKRTKCHTET
ncbi:uncharacterized protein At1g08160-like [Macadamia integrifolia]|uniref:uncharacterized protein At1g08160-like n=1 Tax=Macadamia integrifolia TaxID=60698 RepID=UPI001C4E3FD5|nr:uncharacterized protein At1g08160-like [Macadamia integrifolia]